MFGKKFLITDKNATLYAEKISRFIKERVSNARCTGVVLGMSGGIDCSVVACLANLSGVPVKLVLMPYGDDMRLSGNLDHALLLIRKFHFDYSIVDIKPICDALESSLQAVSSESRLNIRPRIRMTILYSIAQSEHRLVAGTGNLDERLLGYFTKWGDGAHDFNPLGYMTKGEVRALGAYLGVPREIIDKPPSADLFEGQTDESDFGFTYSQMDSYIINGTSENDPVDLRISKRIDLSSHKLNPITIFNEDL